MAGGKIALVIGNNYPNSDKELKFAVADAVKIKEVLENKDICGFDEVIFLPDRTSKEALIEVEKLFKRDENLVLLYFSGHGKKDFTNDLCLLFRDTEEDTLLATSLTFDFINKCILYPAQRSVIVVLDCSYSGVAKLDDYEAGKVILTSTGSNGSSSARENEKLGHGTFTYYLIEGLEKGPADKDGDGYVSIDELFEYVSEKAKENHFQPPRMIGGIESESFFGRNPLKIKEKEFKMKTKRILKEFSDQLPDPVLDESLTILRKKYENPSSMKEEEIDICRLLDCLLDGKLSVNNYNISVQNLKEMSINYQNPLIRGNICISENGILSQTPIILDTISHEISEKKDIPKNPYNPSEVNKNIKSFQYDVFICHSSKDKPIVTTLIDDLKKEQITYWIDAEQIRFGDQITRRIEDGLQKSRYVIPCLSKNLTDSGWTRAEYGSILNAEFSGSSERIIIPLKLDNCEDDAIPLLLRDKKNVTYSDKTELYELIQFLRNNKTHITDDMSN